MKVKIKVRIYQMERKSESSPKISDYSDRDK